MPRYDFQCRRCERIEEHFFEVDNKPILIHCIGCGILQPTMHPIISKVNLGHIDQGRLQSVAFGKEFKNERDMLHYAKHVGAEPIGDEKVESVQKIYEDKTSELENKRHKELAEGIEWSTLS